MDRIACGVVAVAVLAAAALTSRPAGADDKPPTIREVMQKLHKGANSPMAFLKKELKAPSPDWKAVQDRTKDYVILGAALAKNDPPRGDAAAYKPLAEAFFGNSKALDDAAKMEDKAATEAAFGKLGQSCMACHRAHRPPPQ